MMQMAHDLYVAMAEPLGYDYMRKALCIAALLGGVCACLSCFVTLKGWSLLGDGLSHAVVPGVVVAYKIGWPFTAGAFVAGMLSAGMMGYLKAITRIRQDAVIGIVYTTWFALGLLLISMYPSSVQLKTIMFGDILAVAPADMVQMVIVSAIVIIVILARWKDMVVYCFDPSHARTIGLNVKLLDMTLLMLMAGTAIAALQAVGATLVMALLITPGATAYLLTNRFGRMMILATVLGATTAAAGAYASYFFNGSTGGCIVVLQTFVFFVVFTFAPHQGLIASWRRGRAAAAQLHAQSKAEAAA